MLDQLPSPAVLVDEERLQQNLQEMQSYADLQKVKLRPHFKTHKSLLIADWQRQAGVRGMTVARLHEAKTLILQGWRSITVAYPMVEGREIRELLELSAGRLVDLRLVVDSQPGLEAIRAEAELLGFVVSIYLKIDVGLHRCGLSPGSSTLLTLAKAIQKSPALDLIGVLSHAGHCYAAKTKGDLTKIAAEEMMILSRSRKRLEAAGHVVREVSVGATPTLLTQPKLKGITEIRPGNYVYLDRMPLSQGIIKKKHIALSVLATVISQNKDYSILNVGSKTLSSDAGAHGSTAMKGHGLVFPLKHYPTQKTKLVIEKLSEEHAMVPRLKKFPLTIGQRVRIIPNHACVVGNLMRHFYLVGKDGVKKVELDA